MTLLAENSAALTTPQPSRWRPRLTERGIGRAICACVAAVWLYHGLVNKLLGASPRHLMIVQSVPGLGGSFGERMLALVAVAEVMIAVWIMLGWRPRSCCAVQTVFLVAMNAVELTWARPHLLCPAALMPVNLLFLATAWLGAELRSTGQWPTYRLRRHPLPVRAFFEHSLVLTYAFPPAVLEALLPPGLTLDTHNGFGFLAVAMVQTRGLRPTFMPRALGQDFVLTGYRIFTKLSHGKRTRRGLRILRSDADRGLMVAAGNLLTHYHYRRCHAEVRQRGGKLIFEIRTQDADADVDVIADLSTDEESLPVGSPFATLHDARRYAGPLPYTFDYEAQTHSIIAIKGVRENWQPRLVPVDVRAMTFLDHPSLKGARPVLASAFYVHEIPYLWKCGRRIQLPREGEAVNTTHTHHSRFHGLVQIARFNWPFYVIASTAVLAAAVLAATAPLPNACVALLIAGVVMAAYWVVASLVASHWIYDCSALSRWDWVAAALPTPPQQWINLHCGLDESTLALRRIFPQAQGRVLDIYTAEEMTEPSIRRARQLAHNEVTPEPADYRRLPVADASTDAAMLLLSAHELRKHDSRIALFRELHRVIRSGAGRIIVAEHLRDFANFLAFGPGFLHFHSRRAWRRAFADAGLTIERSFRITPFIAVFILRRSS